MVNYSCRVKILSMFRDHKVIVCSNVTSCCFISMLHTGGHVHRRNNPHSSDGFVCRSRGYLLVHLLHPYQPGPSPQAGRSDGRRWRQQWWRSRRGRGRSDSHVSVPVTPLTAFPTYRNVLRQFRTGVFTKCSLTTLKFMQEFKWRLTKENSSKLYFRARVRSPGTVACLLPRPFHMNKKINRDNDSPILTRQAD